MVSGFHDAPKAEKIQSKLFVKMWKLMLMIVWAELQTPSAICTEENDCAL